ncbi:hypothetical protein barba138A_phanotate29 [Rheinheimera phage vB_RspM_barba_13-8A]|uniref:Uncharacterized protein n=2 Tax=Barbavirus barba18A TaxID=2734090 RepID=A0A4P8N282_9CAUD|nr:hypothetical protein Barba9A_gp027 [Rheinheimera phage vB_RspM_Barba9A]QNO10140.1 hypothetical protein barba138A_phanotate29 [Rheinheimera phage vB_RspM_barba_13-8A]
MKTPNNRQEANALLALRLHTKRELQAELFEINDEIKQLENYIKMCQDSDQIKLF